MIIGWDAAFGAEAAGTLGKGGATIADGPIAGPECGDAARCGASAAGADGDAAAKLRIAGQ